MSEARLGVTVARYAYLPSFGLDVFYGIDANQFAAQTERPNQPERPKHAARLPGVLTGRTWATWRKQP